MNLPAFLRPLSLEERISRELTDARLARLSTAAWLEHHSALQGMYETRIRRLEQELQDCLDDPQDLHMIGGSR